MFKKLPSIVFALAFLASGWSTVLASALCDHKECMVSPAAEEHHAAQESKEPAGEHCSKVVGPTEHRPGEASVEAGGEKSAGKSLRGASGHTQSCLHCVGAPPAPARSSFGVTTQSQTRNGADVDAPHVIKELTLPEVASFPALRPTQGSPPTPVQRRHLLINIFLI